jgi:membrane-bound lytic murein transglycosylase B
VATLATGATAAVIAVPPVSGVPSAVDRSVSAAAQGSLLMPAALAFHGAAVSLPAAEPEASSNDSALGHSAVASLAVARVAGIVASSPLAAGGIPATALDAYERAATGAPTGCHIGWSLLAAIGRVESNHGRFRGAVLQSDGLSAPPIIGLALTGVGTAHISDTDGGRLDADPVYDHAVGPMQFIPSTWARYAADGNGDLRIDPFNIYDASRAAATYLCVAGGDLATDAGRVRAVLAYNHSDAYVATVLALAATYAGVPPPALIAGGTPPPSVPAASPGPPPAIGPTAAAPASSTPPVTTPPATPPATPPVTTPPATTPPTTTPPATPLVTSALPTVALEPVAGTAPAETSGAVP